MYVGWIRSARKRGAAGRSRRHPAEEEKPRITDSVPELEVALEQSALRKIKPFRQKPESPSAPTPQGSGL